MERPDLALHMKCVNMHVPLRRPEEPEQRVIEDCVVKLGALPLPFAWAACEKMLFELLPLELVLMHTPNLERLRLRFEFNHDLYLIPQLIGTRPPFFSNLKSLEVVPGKNFSSIALVDALVQAAPNLHCLCLGSTNYDASFPTAPLFHLRRLVFQSGCRIHPKLPTEILSNAPELEFLALHWGDFPDPHMYERGVEERCPTRVWEAIERCHDSLLDLRVHISDTIERRLYGRRDSLRDFRRLEVLKVNGHALNSLYEAWERKNWNTARPDSFLSNIFPPTIREVMFWDLDGLAMRAEMQSFARVAASGVYRSLEKVTVALSERRANRYELRSLHTWDSWALVEAELKEGFAKGGASFNLVELDEGDIWGCDVQLYP
jgi:hypothetical protein